jgi:hypothetical protein
LRERGLSEEEKKEYQRIIDFADRIFKAVKETAVLSPNDVQTLQRLTGFEEATDYSFPNMREA